MYSERRALALAALGAAIVLPATAASAAVLEQGVSYHLHNHPDGSAAEPFYGLRLDELMDVTSGHDVFTFDFDAPDAAMFIDYGIDGTLRIHGTAWGGLDTGSGYDPQHSGLVQIDFTFGGVTVAEGDDDLIVTGAPDFTNTGDITLWNGDSIGLWDFSGNHGYTFRLGDGDNDLGHRGFDGLSGWGWLDHGAPGTHVAASDWLFTVGPAVPAPGSLALLGLAGLAGRRRRD